MVIMILSASWNSTPRWNTGDVNTTFEQKEEKISSYKKYLPYWSMNPHILSGHQAHQYLQVSHDINMSFALVVLRELLMSRGNCGGNG